jgi:hypothetical protein
MPAVSQETSQAKALGDECGSACEDPLDEHGDEDLLDDDANDGFKGGEPQLHGAEIRAAVTCGCFASGTSVVAGRIAAP